MKTGKLDTFKNSQLILCVPPIITIELCEARDRFTMENIRGMVTSQEYYIAFVSRRTVKS